MGFSEETKRELAHVYPETNCCRLAELSAYYDFNGYHFGSYLDINHFMPLIARKILTLTKQVFPEAATQVLVQKARARKNQFCTVRVLTKQAAEEFYQALRDQDYLDDDKKCWLRTAARERMSEERF